MIVTAIALANSVTASVMGVRMRSIYISAAASVDVLRPRASLRVALHVTNRQHGAKASDRLSVNGGIWGGSDSEEAVRNEDAEGAFSRWSGEEYQRQRST